MSGQGGSSSGGKGGGVTNRLPLVEELTPAPDVFALLSAFAACPSALLFESALQREDVGRYSFLTADPLQFWEVPKAVYGSDPFSSVQRVLRESNSPRIDDLPPFQGGIAGLLSYELGRCWERMPRAPRDEFKLPDAAIGLYDWVIAWDHAAQRAWIISHGDPNLASGRRVDSAAQRLNWVRGKLRSLEGSAQPLEPMEMEEVPATELARQWPAPGLEGLTSDFSRDGYLRAVQRVIDYVHAGDIFQANLSQRLLYPALGSPLNLYGQLRRHNPAPFAAYLACGDWAVVSASPERFVSVRNGEVETRPIKGTRQRCRAPEADLFTRDELRESDKDQAENVMIVDLLRNDLSRVCESGSIRVPQLCGVETYETVQHLVSVVQGALARNLDAFDLLRAVFPGGSVTGAPKIRAMEIIAELEPTVRGPYCGSMFYVGFDGAMDSSILIRTFTCRGGWVQCPVGGGIVAQSDPVSEYEETLHKAVGMLSALRL